MLTREVTRLITVFSLPFGAAVCVVHTDWGPGMGWSLLDCSATRDLVKHAVRSLLTPGLLSFVFTWEFYPGLCISSWIQNAQRLCGGLPQVYHLSLLELHRNQTPVPVPSKIQWNGIPFVLSSDVGIASSGFFPLSPSAFNFLFSLTSVFSAFFHSFVFSLLPPFPPYVLQILSYSRITLFDQCHSNHSSPCFCFLTTFLLPFIHFPAIHFHLQIEGISVLR